MLINITSGVVFIFRLCWVVCLVFFSWNFIDWIKWIVSLFVSASVEKLASGLPSSLRVGTSRKEKIFGSKLRSPHKLNNIRKSNVSRYAYLYYLNQRKLKILQVVSMFRLSGVLYKKQKKRYIKNNFIKKTMARYKSFSEATK